MTAVVLGDSQILSKSERKRKKVFTRISITPLDWQLTEGGEEFPRDKTRTRCQSAVVFRHMYYKVKGRHTLETPLEGTVK